MTIGDFVIVVNIFCLGLIVIISTNRIVQAIKEKK